MITLYPFSALIPPSMQPSNSPFLLQPTFDLRRSTRKEGTFIYKHGQRHHSYDSEKAPYPLSYDRAVLELEALENKLVQHLRGSVSFTNFKQPPERVLDLGCGLGTWVIDAAKEWPECEFVGFDLMNVQIPLQVLDPSLAHRIEWRHGNFLTTKLPFEDDEFDHIRVSMIAKGVPENKWGILFEEINRVLAPGGSCEVIEEDIVFPKLPRWFTQALRPKRTYSPHDRQHHDHALLESLNAAVYEQRFINTTPTAVLPSYFTTYFRQVTIGPVIHFPMPPLAPLPPLPPQTITTYVVEPETDSLDAGQSTSYPTLVPMNRPTSLSFSSTLSSNSVQTVKSSDSVLGSRPRTVSASMTTVVKSSQSTGSSSLLSPPQETVPVLPAPDRPTKQYMLDGSLSESEIAALPRHLFPVEQLSALSERSLAMQLYRSCQIVLGCQEAMWEELKDRIRNKREELVEFGWEDDDELEELQSRVKFEKLIERFKSDMHMRISFWYSLTNIGWSFPEREPLSKAEFIEEERIQANMLEARKQAKLEDFHTPSRSMRVLVGSKL